MNTQSQDQMERLIPLFDALKNNDLNIRDLALFSLGLIGNISALEPIIENYSNATDEHQRFLMLQALAWIFKANQDSEQTVAFMVSSFSQNLSHYIPDLIREMNNDDPDIQIFAVHVLGSNNSKDAIPALIDLLKNAHKNQLTDDVLSQAVYALGQIDRKTTISSLNKMLLENQPESRSTAAWALGTMVSEESVENLLLSMSDVETVVRENAAWALGQIVSPQSVETLIKAMHDPSEVVREYAAWALGSIEDIQALEPLRQCLDESSEEVLDKIYWAIEAIEYAAPRKFFDH